MGEGGTATEETVPFIRSVQAAYWLCASDAPLPSPHVSCVVLLEFGLQLPPVLDPPQLCLHLVTLYHSLLAPPTGRPSSSG